MQEKYFGHARSHDKIFFLISNPDLGCNSGLVPIQNEPTQTSIPQSTTALTPSASQNSSNVPVCSGPSITIPGTSIDTVYVQSTIQINISYTMPIHEPAEKFAVIINPPPGVNNLTMEDPIEIQRFDTSNYRPLVDQTAVLNYQEDEVPGGNLLQVNANVCPRTPNYQLNSEPSVMDEKDILEVIRKLGHHREHKTVDLKSKLYVHYNLYGIDYT